MVVSLVPGICSYHKVEAIKRASRQDTVSGMKQTAGIGAEFISSRRGQSWGLRFSGSDFVSFTQRSDYLHSNTWSY